MSKLEWDKSGERYYETGVSHGVLYIPNALGSYTNGYAWNGLTAVNASPSGAESTKQYADNIAYLNMTSAEEFNGTIEAFQSPREFDQCDGTATPVPGIGVGQQTRRSFGFSYETLIGNDIDGQDHGFKIHVVYGAQAAPSERSNATVNDSPEAMALSWEFTTTPASVTPEIIVNGRALKPTATLSFSSLMFPASKMQELKDILHGTTALAPRLPSPNELITLMSSTILEAVPTPPTFDADVITIPTVAGVVYKINGVVVEGVVSSTEPTMVYAEPAVGYKFPDVVATQWAFNV